MNQRQQVIGIDDLGRRIYILDAYTQEYERESRTVSGLMVVDRKTIICPQCGWKNKNIEHGKSANCSECNLHMEVLGNSLITSRWQRR